jgi:hypothetical protein
MIRFIEAITQVLVSDDFARSEYQIQIEEVVQGKSKLKIYVVAA